MVSKKSKILGATVGALSTVTSAFSATCQEAYDSCTKLKSVCDAELKTCLETTSGAEQAINKAGETFLGLGEVGANWLLIFAGVVLFFSLVFIGIQYMWARKGEDGDKLRTVNNWFKAWVIGFIIVLVAWGAKGFFFSFGQ